MTGLSQPLSDRLVDRAYVCPVCAALTVDPTDMPDGLVAETPICVQPKRRGWEAHSEPMIPFVKEARLNEARVFLSSIASAQSQGTREQTDWMIEQARKGLETSE